MKKARRPREKEDPDNTWNMQFMAAAKVGDVEAMEALIEKGAEVDHVVREGEGDDERIDTPLLNRARAGDVEMVRWLAAKGADPNRRMEQGMTPLHYAVLHDLHDLIELLLSELRVESAVRDVAGFTAVELAIQRSKVETAQLLLKLGAVHDFRVRGDGPHTQTQQACLAGNLPLLTVLLDLGESVHQRDFGGNSLAHLAAMREHRHVLEELLARRANINATNLDGATPLWLCVEAGLVEEIAFLVGKGASVACCNRAGTTVLQCAVYHGRKNVVAKLLELGASPTQRDAYNESALHTAASGRHPDILDLLLTKLPEGTAAAETNAANKDGLTPLHKAAKWNRPEMIKALLWKDADPNVPDARGRTALHEASQQGNVAAVTELLNYDPVAIKVHAESTKKKTQVKRSKKDEEKELENLPKPTEVDAETKEGLTPLQLAMAAGHPAVVELLIKHGANVQRASLEFGTVLHQAVSMGNQPITSLLVAGGADVNSIDAHHRPPLHLAVERRHLSVAQFLVAHGANKDAQDEPAHWSALHVACNNGAHELASFLLVEAGVTVDIRDHAARTPLHVCAEAGTAALVPLLKAAGADINAVEHLGRTALHLACEHSRPEVVQALLREGAFIEARDRRGWAPLHVAVFAGCTRAAELLVDAGCQLNDPENNYRTPLMLAAEAGKTDCARLLISRAVAVQDHAHTAA